MLTPIFDPTFSTQSFGFRPGRSAHNAVQCARPFIEAGNDWVVDVDLEKFFDRVNHDKLTVRIWKWIKDKRVLHLIRRYLQAGVMLNGAVVATEEGNPQDGPLSPLLANVMLDDLDRFLTERGTHSAGTPTTATFKAQWTDRETGSSLATASFVDSEFIYE